MEGSGRANPLPLCSIWQPFSPPALAKEQIHGFCASRRFDLWLLCFQRALAQVALTDTVPTITVVGHARTEVVPDFVTMSLAVVSEKPTASAAAAANAQAAQAVVQELEDQGIDPKDIRTSEVSLMPVYDNVSDAVGHTSSQKLRGYQARNGVKIRVSDISKAGALAGRLIDRGRQ
ncbi:MAG: SIMPL domain-containing protein [Methylovirgula sp.]